MGENYIATPGITKKRLAAYLSSAMAFAIIVCQVIESLVE